MLETVDVPPLPGVPSPAGSRKQRASPGKPPQLAEGTRSGRHSPRSRRQLGTSWPPRPIRATNCVLVFGRETVSLRASESTPDVTDLPLWAVSASCCSLMALSRTRHVISEGGRNDVVL